jgi:hypothetical protein
VKNSAKPINVMTLYSLVQITVGPVAVVLTLGCTGETDNEDIDMNAPRPGQNRLAAEKSPYLLQHANNPVDWYPWGEEAFAAARAQDKPIFLSIGYSTCHWCHVMEHESFENDSIAELMNGLFISIKVDREERPDVDQVYMRAVQAMTQSAGGWPLSVFLTPDLKPFFGGTYFPPDDRYGRPGFPSVLRQIADIYRTRREDIARVTEQVTEFLKAGPEPHSEAPGPEVMNQAFDQLRSNFDATWGGFGRAPKFPRSMTLSFLMRFHKRSGDTSALQMATRTLDKMADGGMYDHLGGGFHRYSVDDQWLVPHFEKMLYDNALLARAYLEAFQLTGNARYGGVARSVFSYLLRDMNAPGGAFYAAEDADSEGREGKFYVWSREEVDRILGAQSGLFCDYYDISAGGNFEGENILWTPRSLDSIARAHEIEPDDMRRHMELDREALFRERAKRIRPHRDEKILTAWNGLAIGAFALGYQVLGDEEFLHAARRTADFVLSELWNGETLKARWADGEVRYDAYLDDYAFLAWGLFDLYEASFEPRYLKAAFDLLDAGEKTFAAPEGGYYFAPASNTDLLARPQEVYDGAIPSGNAVMVVNLLKRSEFTGDLSFRQRAETVLRAYRGEIEQQPSAFPQMLCALDFFYGRPREIVVAGSVAAAKPLLRALQERFDPNRVLLLRDSHAADIEEIAPITQGKTAPDGQARAYVCRDFTCKLPTSDMNEMLRQLDAE